MLNNLMTKAYVKFAQFKDNKDGVTAIEYGLIAMAVAALIVVVFYNPKGFIAQLQAGYSKLASGVADTVTSFSFK